MAEHSKSKSTGGFYRFDVSPCREYYVIIQAKTQTEMFSIESPPDMDDEGGGVRRAGGEGPRKSPRSPLQTMQIKNRLGSSRQQVRETYERERIDMLEDIEANKDPR